MASPSEYVLSTVQAHKEGLTSNRIVLVSMCDMLASLGNLCVLAIYDSDYVANSSTVTL